MADIANRDQNHVPAMLLTSSVDGVSPVTWYGNPVTHRALVETQISKTVTPAGTTGAQVINTLAGSVNFAAAAASLVVTNSLVTTNSVILVSVATNDATMTSAQVVAGSGSFTIFAISPPTAETRVNFYVIN